MNEYLLFAGPNYYPSGGYEDFIQAFSSYEETLKHVHNLVREDNYSYNWFQIVHNHKIIYIAQYENWIEKKFEEKDLREV